jgi:P4 family phage/plasmid primase-like protien
MTNKIIKDGIHIQSPDISLTNEKQAVLRAWILEQNAIEAAFEGVGYTTGDHGVRGIYDGSLNRNQPWFLYGESKPDIAPYKVESVITYDPADDTVTEEVDTSQYQPRELMELLSVRYHVKSDTNIVRPEKKSLYDKLLRSEGGRAVAPVEARVPAATEAGEGQAAVAPTETAVYIPDSHEQEEIELAKEIALACLSVKRANDYKTWREVGWCLYNIDESEEMFDTWKNFSKKSPKSGGTDWDRLKADWMRGNFSRGTIGSKLTLKSLHYWARDDNLEKYNELIEDDHVRYVQYRVDDTHFHVAKLLRRMYKGRFCASVESKKTEWFVFDDKVHTWRHTNQGMDLKTKLSTEVADLVVRAKLRLKKKGWEKHCQEHRAGGDDGAPDGDGSDWYKSWAGTVDGSRFASLTKIETHLYKEEFKSGVMRAAIELFHEEDFSNRLNMNSYLFACKNGVLDLCNEVVDPVTGQMKKCVIFRAGRPDDYMSHLAGRNGDDSEPLEYVEHDPSNPKFKELMGFLAKIFPTAELKAYYIRLMASCLEGNNREQCYYTFIGVGGNGKSKVIDLMRYTFGEYCSSLSATALTRSRPDSGAANPDIIAIKNKRFIYLQEPDDREPLNTSRMKQFSGEDVVEARGLYEDQQRFRITGKLFMMCNRLPPILSMDRGTWRRIRVLKFGSKFVETNDPDLKAGRPNVFLRDNDLDTKIREWREVWLGLLVHIYQTEYLVKGLEPIPQAVLEESNKYKESFDQYGKFKAERMIDFRDARLNLREDGSESVTLKDVSAAYTSWVRQNEGTLTGKKLTKQELQNRLEEDFGNLDGGIYKRCVVFFDEDGKEEFHRQHATEE